MALREKTVKRRRPTPRKDPQEAAQATISSVMVLNHIPTGKILTAGQTVRDAQDDDHVIELASSIAKHGLLEPIVVEDLGSSTYQLVAGFHRLAACIRMGWNRIPANVRTHNEEVPVRSLALVENICRKDMSLSEEVEAVAVLHDTEKLSPSEICQLVGKSRAWVDRRLALPNLDTEVAGACFAGLISLTMAETLSQVEDEGVRRQILNEAVYGRRTLSQVKDLIKLYAETPTMEGAVAAGMDKAKELQETQSPSKPCAACGKSRSLLELANIWVCSAGCDEDRTDPEAGGGNIPHDAAP